MIRAASRNDEFSMLLPESFAALIISSRMSLLLVSGSIPSAPNTRSSRATCVLVSFRCCCNALFSCGELAASIIDGRPLFTSFCSQS
jgi:hypothetical protein